MRDMQEIIDQYQDDIAVIAMAGRFPGANTVEQFWQNLEREVESVRFFTQEELLQSGVDPTLLENPNFVGAEGVLNDVDKFDAEFFGYSPREAELLDPQHRIYLETIWELLERAGYSNEQTKAVIGVYSGAGASSYLSRNLLTHPEFVRDVGTFKVSLSTGQDFVTTRASYKLGLTGPSVNINTLCSSSAVAVHYAREALLAYQCDIAVAGGVTISNSREDALFYQEGGIGSFDGHCRTFDARAAGTVAGNGIALVALKRMEDALHDGDQILGVIRATAINNDGGDKASYTAPSPEGQARVITEALEIAGINPESISYIEAHGTGTNLGDPIEVSGLTRAYRHYTQQKNYCGIGSVKTNIGHLVSAGGVASMIKTIMAMQHRKIPASLNFEAPNPKIDFANSPFYVVAKTQPWEPTGGNLLRAGVSSFGIGGTNAHIIVEEAPAIEENAGTGGKQAHSILLSAKTGTALLAMKQNLREYVANSPSLNLADLAFTLQLGRHSFEHKFAATVSSLDELVCKLEGSNMRYVVASIQKNTARDICFMFPGQGSQYIGMGKSLYTSEPLFKHYVDLCADIAKPLLKRDIRDIIYAAGTEHDSAEELQQTAYAQLSVFATEYALAQLLMSWGVVPTRMIGHSIGEYVAASLAGVFALEDAVRTIVRRGELMASMSTGSMISVALDEEAIQLYLSSEVWHSVQNSAQLQVLSGDKDVIAKLADRLEHDGVSVTKLHTSHGFHSGMMDPVLSPFTQYLSKITLNTPRLKFISNLTGRWAGDEVASPAYWADHLRHTVRFGDGIATLLAEDAQQFFLEIGPGHALSAFVNAQKDSAIWVANTLPHPRHTEESIPSVLSAMAQLWASGIRMDWAAFYEGQHRRRICLPTYPFERKRYWIDAAPTGSRKFQPDLVLTQTTKTPLPDSIQEGILRFELVSSNAQQASISEQQWRALLDIQTEFSGRLEQVLGADFSVTAPGIELRLARQSGAANTIESDIQDATTLASAVHGRPMGAANYVAPQNEIQQILVEHWQEVLGYAPVGIEDNFFEVGGHSLMAAALVTRTRKNFDVTIPLRELLETPTIAELSELIQNRLWLQTETEQADGVEVLEL